MKKLSTRVFGRPKRSVSLTPLSGGLGLAYASLANPAPPPPQAHAVFRARIARQVHPTLYPWTPYLVDAGVIVISLACYIAIFSPMFRYGGHRFFFLLALEASTVYEMLGFILLLLANSAIVAFYTFTFRWFLGATIGEVVVQRYFSSPVTRESS
jgi:hypothetical protein